MKTGLKLVGLSALFALGMSACSAADTQGEGGTDLGDNKSDATRAQLAQLDEDLAIGSSGDSVRSVHAYLSAHGYFPNAELSERFPAWRAIVAEGPQDESVYDETTVEAIQALQRNAGLLETGIVDAPTRAILTAHRCGVPDGIEAADSADKYALQGSKWASTSLTWKVTNNNDVTLTQARAAAAAAFASWQAQTGLTFTQITGAGAADIQITFAAIDGAGGVLAQAFYPQSGGDVTVDTAETWSVASPTPAGNFDLQTILLHELGHSLGIAHSSLSAATLYPFASSGSQDRVLDIDDNVGISMLYDSWTQLPGCAKDIGVGTNGVAWVIGCGAGADGTLFRWNGADWTVDSANGAAARVDVGPTGIPWVVTSNGSIYRRSSSSAASGSWTLLPGCAKDIGVGGDGSAWVIGCGAGADGTLFKWNGASWTVDAANGVAAQVTVGPTGIPWVSHSNGSIFRRSSSNVAAGSWAGLPGLARDIGLSGGNYAWAIGVGAVAGGFEIYSWNEQSAFGTAPARAQWINKPGGAVRSDVGPNGRPWVVNNGGGIFVATK